MVYSDASNGSASAEAEPGPGAAAAGRAVGGGAVGGSQRTLYRFSGSWFCVLKTTGSQKRFQQGGTGSDFISLATHLNFE